jgi:crotonobetainyl-CoA:carnitine CoA-transferase CaiB-like acyl-CoA transferase
MDYLLNGRVAGPQGNRRAGIAPHGVYRTAGDDSWIAIVARNDAEWSALRGVAGKAAGELHDDRFARMEERLANQDALDAAIERWTSSLDAAELSEALQTVGVPASPVMTPPMLLADANTAALRDAGVELESPGSVQLDQIFQGVVWKLERTPGHITVPAPRLGQHTDEVLRERLSLSDGELASLRESGVI